MSSKNETKIVKDASGKKLTVTRDFNAPVAKVWRAWTESDLLQKWWAPRPWRAETKTMDFKAGGFWLYAMVSPEGERHWNKVDFHTVDAQKSFTATAIFCDADSKPLDDFPEMHWKNEFTANGTGTTVTSEISFDNTAGFEKIVQMGFEGGFTMAQGNLDELLAE